MIKPEMLPFLLIAYRSEKWLRWHDVILKFNITI